MKIRTARTVVVLSFGALLATAVSAQTHKRTAWGTPDFNGVWDSGTLTPLERPAAMKGREFLTEEEAEAIRGTGVERVMKLAAGTLEGKLTGELTEAWLGVPEEVVRSLRTSLIVDPPDGKIPYTPEGRKRRNWQRFIFIAPTAPTDGPEVRSMANRCLGTGALYEPNPLYLNYHAIIQTQDYVVIRSELLETRIIPLDASGPPEDPSIRRWSGASRGHWEGDTLVVETTNFNGKSNYFGATKNLRVVERLTLADADTIDYRVTFEDPESFTRAWTTENTLRAMSPPIYEFACHEGNYAMGGILRGARLQEREAAARAAKDD